MRGNYMSDLKETIFPLQVNSGIQLGEANSQNHSACLNPTDDILYDEISSKFQSQADTYQPYKYLPLGILFI